MRGTWSEGAKLNLVKRRKVFQKCFHRWGSWFVCVLVLLVSGFICSGFALFLLNNIQ